MGSIQGVWLTGSCLNPSSEEIKATLTFTCIKDRVGTLDSLVAGQAALRQTRVRTAGICPVLGGTVVPAGIWTEVSLAAGEGALCLFPDFLVHKAASLLAREESSTTWLTSLVDREREETILPVAKNSNGDLRKKIKKKTTKTACLCGAETTQLPVDVKGQQNKQRNRTEDCSLLPSQSWGLNSISGFILNPKCQGPALALVFFLIVSS